MAKNKKSKNLQSYVMLAIILGFGIWFWLRYENHIIEPALFFGTVNNIENGVISVIGFSYSVKSSKGEIVTIEVIIGPNTKIIKESGEYKLRVVSDSDQPPSQEDITREREEVDFTTLRDDVKSGLVSIKIASDTKNDDFGKVIAGEIYYNTDNHFYDH